MKILDVLKTPRYLGIAVISAIAIFFLYAYTQVLGIVANLDIWFSVIPLHNLVIFTIFSALFGITLSYQVYLWRQPKTCAIKKRSTPGMIGTVATFLVVQCPACASLGALFLPLGVIAALSIYSIWITLAGIALVLFTLVRLGGFRK